MSSSSANGYIIRRMEFAAEDFLAALADDQKSVASLDFADEDERRNWHYTPVERKGLMLKDMDGWQVELAHRLLGTGLSGSGMHRARTIIDLESILGEMEGPGGKWKRDPERYYVSVFGTPGNGEWGWRFEGHHVSVNYTIVNGELIGPTPVFLGANPAKVLHGSTVELSIGTAARAHLLAAMPNVDLPCYPAGPLVYQEEVCREKVRYENGHFVVPDGPGLGVEIDEDRLTAQRL